MIVWTAGHNMPGYLPESEPAAFRTRLEALEYVIEDLERVANSTAELVTTLTGNDAGVTQRWVEEYDQAAHALRARDADVDGDWCGTFEDGRIAYWFESQDMPDDEAEAALAGDA